MEAHALHKAVREGHSEEVIFKLGPKCKSKAREEQMENIPGKGDSICRGPGVGRSSHSYRNKAEARRAVTQCNGGTGPTGVWSIKQGPGSSGLQAMGRSSRKRSFHYTYSKCSGKPLQSTRKGDTISCGSCCCMEKVENGSRKTSLEVLYGLDEE